MIYREYLVMRKALAWFACVLLAIMVILFILAKGGSLNYAGIANGSGWFSAIFASIFGVALGNASREASRVLWVLPTQRWKVALQAIAVDLAGTTVAFAYVYFLILTLAGTHFEINGTWSATEIALPLLMAYGAYGWSALIGVLGRRMAYCGIIVLPALMIWMILARSQSAVGAMLRAPLAANPFAVYNAALTLNGWSQMHFRLDAIVSSLQWLGTTWAMPMLITIAVATCGIAVALWNRAEVIT